MVSTQDKNAAAPIMKAIVCLIEKWLRRETIKPSEFNELEEQMEMYWDEYEKKNPRAGPYDSYLSAWLIHEQLFLAGTPHASGGPPYYFWDLIEEECAGGEPQAERQFKHCTELFGTF